jgi:hypothetical protein
VKKALFLLAFLLSGVVFLHAQMEQHAFIQDHTIDEADSNKLFLSVVNQNIIKNNEYFNHVTPGYTLLGSQLNLQLKYYPTKNTMIEGGIHLLYYYGRDKTDRVMPLIRFSYTPVKGMYIILGNVYGSLYHHFPEPMYKFERFMEDPPEIGFQFLYDNDWVHADVYINWRYFLLPDDLSHKEVFTAGISTYVNLLNPKKHRFQLQIPIQYLYNHQGGQLDTLDQPLTTITNACFGIRTGYKFSRFVKKVSANFYYLTYHDASGEKRMPFDNGYGLMPEVSAESKFVNLYAGYWKGHQYIAPIGQQLFSSVSSRYEYQDDVFPDREMFYFKLDLHHTITKSIYAGIRYEGYLDLLGNTVGPNDNHYDFSYSIYLNFSHNFFLIRTK